MRSATYELTERGGKRAVARRLAAAFAVAQHAAHEETRVYYDTFDGRLYRAGQDLWVTANGRVKTLSWCAGDTELELPVRSVPESAATLPQGRLREAVAGSTARRRLLPQVAVRRAALRLDLLDGEEKTVARVRIAERSVRDGRGRGPWTVVATVVELEPVRGYDAAFEALERFVEDELALPRHVPTEVEEACAAVGRAPGRDPSHLSLELAPDEQAGAAVGRAHLALLGVMRANEEGVRDELDPEFLHDFRVAVRRARTLLSQVPDVLPQAAVEHYGSELAWLADETGDARDLDVLTLSAEAWEEPLPEDVRAALAPFWDLVRERARASHERLNAVLASQRYARLVATWRELLERGSAGLERLPDARRTVADVAAERIARRYRKLRKKARRLPDADDPDAALHEVRIDAKKLRYLLEIFRTAFADEDVDALVKPLKKLQSSLGDANDAAVHLAMVRSAAEELAARAPAPVETLLALGRVGATLEERRTSARARGERALAHLLSKSVRRGVQKSFGS